MTASVSRHVDVNTNAIEGDLFGKQHERNIRRIHGQARGVSATLANEYAQAWRGRVTETECLKAKAAIGVCPVSQSAATRQLVAAPTGILVHLVLEDESRTRIAIGRDAAMDDRGKHCTVRRKWTVATDANYRCNDHSYSPNGTTDHTHSGESS